MSALPWIVGVGGAIVVGATVIAIRNEKAKQADGSNCGAVQALAAATIGFLIPPEACGAIDAALGVGGQVIGSVLDGLKGEATKDRENRALNGEIELELTAECKSIAFTLDISGTEARPLLGGSVLRFKNGGVPFAGHPDFAKCAAGTHDMTMGLATKSATGSRGGHVVWGFIARTPGKLPTRSQVGALVRGGDSHALDAFIAQGVTIERMLTAGPGDPTTSKELGIVAGKKWACPSGQVVLSIASVVDHRGGNEVGRAIQVVCGTPGTSAPPPPVAGSGTQIPVGPSPGPNYVWVTDHWERKRAA